MLIGIDSEDAVPNGRNLTRFFAVLGRAPYLDPPRDIFTPWCNASGSPCPIWFSTPPAIPPVKAEIEDGLPQASGGRKEYKDDEGTVTKVVEWFGYELHLLVDVKHEVVSGSFRVSSLCR